MTTKRIIISYDDDQQPEGHEEGQPFDLLGWLENELNSDKIAATICEPKLATTEQIEAARSGWGTDEIEIDGDARISETENGFWIEGWLWMDGNADDQTDPRP